MSRRIVRLLAAIGAIAATIMLLALPSASDMNRPIGKASGVFNSVSAPSSSDAPTPGDVTVTSTQGDGNATPPASADPTTPVPTSESAPAPSSSDTTIAPPTDPSTTHTTAHPSCGSGCSTTTHPTSPSPSASSVSISDVSSLASVEVDQTANYCVTVTVTSGHRATVYFHVGQNGGSFNPSKIGVGAGSQQLCATYKAPSSTGEVKVYVEIIDNATHQDVTSKPQTVTITPPSVRP